MAGRSGRAIPSHHSLLVEASVFFEIVDAVVNDEAKIEPC